jgi:hypothetical protein
VYMEAGPVTPAPAALQMVCDLPPLLFLIPSPYPDIDICSQISLNAVT